MSATNPETKFKEWQIALKNGATLTGISHIPESIGAKTSSGGPLMVAIHGGSCSAYIYDISPEYTASIYSERLTLPLVAINRPNFLGSSGWLLDQSSSPPTSTPFKADEGLSHFEEEARWYHEFIFPALWKEFAVPNGCTSIVTTSHSMAVPITIIASTLYSHSQRDQSAEYVWAGMVLAGFASYHTTFLKERSSELATIDLDPSELPAGQDFSIHVNPYPEKVKTEFMLGPPSLADASLSPKLWKQTTPLFIGEVTDLWSIWPAKSQNYRAAVKLPILFGLGEFDSLWYGTRENVEAFCSGFVASPRVEGAVIECAPHTIELSQVGAAWWTRLMGWAKEVDIGLQIRPLKPSL